MDVIGGLGNIGQLGRDLGALTAPDDKPVTDALRRAGHFAPAPRFSTAPAVTFPKTLIDYHHGTVLALVKDQRASRMTLRVALNGGKVEALLDHTPFQPRMLNFQVRERGTGNLFKVRMGHGSQGAFLNGSPLSHLQFDARVEGPILHISVNGNEIKPDAVSFLLEHRF